MLGQRQAYQARGRLTRPEAGLPEAGLPGQGQAYQARGRLTRPERGMHNSNASFENQAIGMPFFYGIEPQA